MKLEKSSLQNFIEESRVIASEEQIIGLVALSKMLGKEKLTTLMGRTTGKYDDFKESLLNQFEGEDRQFVQDVCTYLLESGPRNPMRVGINGFYGIVYRMDESMYLEMSKMDFQSFGYDLPEQGTPKSLSALVLKLFQTQKHGKVSVLDICSGIGDFLSAAAVKIKDATLYGQEVNHQSILLSKIRAMLLNQAYNIKEGNVLSDSEAFHKETFDLVFSQPPFSLKLEEALAISTKDWPFILKDIDRVKNKSDYIFLNLVINHIKKEGKGYIFVPNGVCFRGGREREWRQQLIQERWIEAVITLPANLFKNTRIPCTLLILSVSNEKIKMIEAEQLETKALRGFKALTDESINHIVEMYTSTEKTEYSAFVGYEELLQNDFSLTPINYVSAGKVTIVNPKLLDVGVIETITGIPLMGKKLEEKISDEGNVECLNTQDFDNYGIVAPLKRINLTEEELDEYSDRFIRKGDLIIVTKGNYKSMVADFEADKHVLLLSPNLTIIRLVHNIWNPYYIKVFFDSPDGQALLKREYRGTAIPVLQKKNLLHISIPEVPMEKQIQTAKEYCAVRENYIKALEHVEIAQAGFYRISIEE